MRPDGWLFLIISWGFIAGLTFYCFRRILKKKTV
jgi:hypothetical protein